MLVAFLKSDSKIFLTQASYGQGIVAHLRDIKLQTAILRTFEAQFFRRSNTLKKAFICFCCPQAPDSFHTFHSRE